MLQPTDMFWFGSISRSSQPVAVVGHHTSVFPWWLIQNFILTQAWPSRQWWWSWYRRWHRSWPRPRPGSIRSGTHTATVQIQVHALVVVKAASQLQHCSKTAAQWVPSLPHVQPSSLVLGACSAPKSETMAWTALMSKNRGHSVFPRPNRVFTKRLVFSRFHVSRFHGFHVFTFSRFSIFEVDGWDGWGKQISACVTEIRTALNIDLYRPCTAHFKQIALIF